MPTKRRITTTKVERNSSCSSGITQILDMSPSSPSLQTPMLAGNRHFMPHRIGTSGATSSDVPLALPIIEGLCRRHGVADDIVKDVFIRWKSGRLIVRNLEVAWRMRVAGPQRVSVIDNVASSSPTNRKCMKQNTGRPQMAELERYRLKQDNEKSQTQQQKLFWESSRIKSFDRDRGYIHWLIQSLSSPSVRERRAALKILTTGCPMDDTSIWNLIELSVFLIKAGNAFRDVDATCMVGWLALLKVLVIRVLSGPERLAYSIRPDIGLSWLCRFFWRISSLLQQQKYPRTGTTFVCLAIVDVVHSLILTGTDETVYQIHKVLWSEKKDTINSDISDDPYLISPLACLMGACHLWTENHRNTKTIDETYVTMMKQLIDPSLLPKIVPQSNGSFSACARTIKKKDQRLSSFLGKHHDSTNTTESGKEKSSAATSAKTAKDRTSLTNSGIENVSASSAAKHETNESISNRNATIATSPGGDSMSSSIVGSPPMAENSMAASVARLFSTLYGSSTSRNDGDDGDTANHVESSDDQELVDVYNDDNDIDGDGDHLMETLSDEEDQDEDNAHDENDRVDEDNEVVKSTDEDGPEEKKEVTVSNDEKDDNEENDDNEINSEDDEEIDSEEGEDCDDCNSVIDMEDDDEHEHDDDEDEIMIHEDELPQIEQGLLQLQRDFNNGSTKPSSSTANASSSNTYPKVSSAQGTRERSQLYINAAMEVLAIQHPPILKSKTSLQQTYEFVPLTIAAERALMSSIKQIVKPDKKPLDGKIILRRAPTQEEFFRGNHSKDIISFSTLKSSSSDDGEAEPTVRDLRQHIANDLQMGDSAECLEVLVANKILDVDLKLRVILQTVWKDHLMQHSGGSSSSSSLSSLLVGGRGGARSFLSSSSGLSLMLYSSLERSMGSAGSGSLSITAETPAEALPPMVITYRLTGVDGEATEDTVSTLKDPEAPSESSSPEEIELLMEKEYGITRKLMSGRGVFCLLRSVQSNIQRTLQKIRRDGVGRSENHARQIFRQSLYPGLSLLVCCAKLPSNRKLLLQARAPTTLLRLLLDVLDALDEDGSAQSSESNSTASGLQELIEVLASDILLSNGDTSSEVTEEKQEDEDAITLRHLIKAVETSFLSRILRNVIAKLVPYLTYGKPKLSKELASEFMAHVHCDQLGDYEIDEGSERKCSSKTQSVLMDTFIHASISLPANEVCNSLRAELLNCGFVERITKHIMQDCPVKPPSWSPSLWSKGEEMNKRKQSELETKWKDFSKRPGLKTSFEVLIGLCKEHQPTQAFLGRLDEGDVSFLQFCHWLESTSDNTSAGISMKGFGLLAETLMDDIAEFGKSSSEEVKKIKSLRKKTRERKKEIAMDRRKKSLMSMTKFSAMTAAPTSGALADALPSNDGDRTAVAPFWAPVREFFCDSSAFQDNSRSSETEASPTSKKMKNFSGKDSGKSAPSTDIVKPEWMKELENMEDETGLTCAVCQEGRKYKSTEMMGLYAYIKKVTIPHGDRAHMDGTMMLTSLPSKLPPSLEDSLVATEWYQIGKAASDDLEDSAVSKGASSSSSSRNRSNCYITTVTAGNAIHISCHAKARLADRNHPKAPKLEWEGAALRNSRVNCNVIFPLVSSRSSSVSLVSVEQALAEHQTAVANMIGVRPKSNLWTSLHDVRLMLLRVSYGEALNADCGGGSLGSNSQLIYHQLSMAKMFENEAQVDAPITAKHARDLSAGFLAACEIMSAEDYDALGKSSLFRGIADSSLMAALTCILFHNTKDDYGPGGDISDCPHPKRRWIIGKELFLRGMLNCAGRRHALAIHSSGCISTRNIGKKRSRSRSFAEWDTFNECTGDAQESSAVHSRKTTSPTTPKSNFTRASIDDYGSAIRPMIVYYAIMDQLSSDFAPNYDDEKIEECANRLVEVIESCQKSKSIHVLLNQAKVSLSHEEIINELQRGMVSA